jgi:hypothetical protein
VAHRDSNPRSSLLLDEYFEAGDDRFLDEVLACASSSQLKGIASRWYADRRPFARQALLRYIDDGCDRPRHRPLVKALFKLAEAAGDDEAMGHFMVAFDRLVGHRIVQRHRYDWTTRQSYSKFVLERERSMPSGLTRANAAGRFSSLTRQYLERRAFRYFRRLGYRDLARYGSAMRAALVLYQDAALDRPERLLDSWGLLHALYWGSPVLDCRPSGIRVAAGHTLAELAPAPIHPDAWKDCFRDLIDVLEGAQSRTVRSWVIAFLRGSYAGDLERLAVADVRRLLQNPHEEVQAFAVEFLSNASGIERLTLGEWLELLEIENLEVLPRVCELAVQHILPAHLSLAECVDLASTRLAPVADLGLRWLRDQSIENEDDLSLVLRLRNVPVPRVRTEAAEWLVSILETSPLARAEHVRDLLDSKHADVRARALGLLARGARFDGDLGLTLALSETPYDDTRAFLVRRLGEWERIFEPRTLRHLWASAMLAVHRGSRVKVAVLEQLSDRLAGHPEEADLLLPILAVALRSVRQTERRNALASVARAAFRTPELAHPIARMLPELRIWAAPEVER